jgi:pimeloyl-ACP methyl ester carboxylesterase
MQQTEAATEQWTHHEAAVNGVRLHYVEAGSGPLVILLHGFPEFWYSWRYQIPALAAAGYRVVAPDMRGYNTSEKPPGVRSYLIDTLADDVAGLIRHLGESTAIVVGHDWGGAVAWYVPMRHPGIVEKLIVLNAPHPGAFARELRTPGQMRKSWYILFFQLPWLPEALFRARGYAILDRVMRSDPVRRDAFADADIRRYKRALSRPGALTGAINYYRALLRRNPREAMQEPPTITCPTLLIWGEQDRYLGVPLTEGLERWVPAIRVERIPEASHWVQIDAPERVNELMLEFLQSE